ncbi:MAG: ATP-binding protein [Leptolyngbyaceae bacterium]|nr:ATP-binding protein [Leptolyngbyaceae bacterium]
MDVPRLQDTSLYETALGSDAPPKPLKISPTTFKSMVESLFDLLCEQEQSASLWVKLPRGKVWQVPIQTYCHHVLRTDPLYLIKTRKDETSDKEDDLDDSSTSDGSSASSLEFFSSVQDGNFPNNHGGAVMLPDLELWLPANSRLRREFFVVAVTPRLQALILAHRPRSARQSYSPVSISHAEETVAASGIMTSQESSERKTSLLGVCSFNPTTIQSILGGLASAIELAYAPYPNEHGAVAAHVAQWSILQNDLSQATPDVQVMDSLWTCHLRRQEVAWRSGSMTRRQADKAAELQLKNDELIHSIRIKDAFFQTTGQELRTPLSTMKTALSLLNSPHLKPGQRQRYMDLLTQECDRQSALITSVLELVQLDNVDAPPLLQPVSVLEVIPGVVSTYQPVAQEKGIMLAYTVPEDLPTITTLAPWLRQILINLLHNAIKFTPENGQVWVKVKRQGEYVQIEVQDTGIGIAPTDVPKIFDRFYRVRSSSAETASGAGLGLSIVQQLLLQCGGSISVNSREGEGSVFKVMMPIHQPDSARGERG